MIFYTTPWRIAQSSDSQYKYYIDHYKNHWPWGRIQPSFRIILYQILNPDPSKRIKIDELLDLDWFKSVEVCDSDTSCGHLH